MMTFEQYIRDSVLSKQEIDTFLSDEPTWARFAPDTGYILGNFMPRDGLDGSLTISTVQANGARRSCVYADRPCRINTYGDSFTQCHQVSDYETWQEYLAGHLGEPVRNFGMGGYGFYQSYRRMLRTERTAEGTEYVILYLWGDDHYRSLLRCRHVLTHRWWNSAGGRLFHGNFWAHAEMDLQAGRYVDVANPLPTPQSLYQMTDGDWMVEALRDDLMLGMLLFCNGEISDLDEPRVNRLAELLGHPPVTAKGADARRKQVQAIADAYAFGATEWILDRAAEFTAGRGKKLMILLLCPRVMRELIATGKRYDQRIVDFLARRGTRVFDMNVVHAADFRRFKVSLEEYLGRYFIGHYSPAGNHFFAYAIKNTVVDWLDPKPITYRTDDQARVGFAGYLPE